LFFLSSSKTPPSDRSSPTSSPPMSGKRILDAPPAHARRMRRQLPCLSERERRLSQFVPFVAGIFEQVPCFPFETKKVGTDQVNLKRSLIIKVTLSPRDPSFPDSGRITLKRSLIIRVTLSPRDPTFPDSGINNTFPSGPNFH
jgi:hypothetical protein